MLRDKDYQYYNIKLACYFQSILNFLKEKSEKDQRQNSEVKMAYNRKPTDRLGFTQYSKSQSSNFPDKLGQKK
jgi:hypothetical protein